MKRRATTAEESDDSDCGEDDVPEVRFAAPRRGRPPGATAKKNLDDDHWACNCCGKVYSVQGGLRAHYREKHKPE